MGRSIPGNLAPGTRTFEELGADYLLRNKSQTELRKIGKEMADLSKRLKELQARKSALEQAMRKLPAQDKINLIGGPPPEEPANEQ